jgi:hypothetical protein
MEKLTVGHRQRILGNTFYGYIAWIVIRARMALYMSAATGSGEICIECKFVL